MCKLKITLFHQIRGKLRDKYWCYSKLVDGDNFLHRPLENLECLSFSATGMSFSFRKGEVTRIWISPSPLSLDLDSHYVRRGRAIRGLQIQQFSPSGNHRVSILSHNAVRVIRPTGLPALVITSALAGISQLHLAVWAETRKPLCLPTSPSPLTFKNTTLALLSSTGVRKGDSFLITFLFLVFFCPDVFHLGLIAVFKIIKCQALRGSQSLPFCFISEETEAEDLVWASENYLSSSSQIE